MSRELRRITVFAGSRLGNNGRFAKVARALGDEMGRRGIGLVYGGGSIGLMGVIADAVLETGGEVIGVIPEGLVVREMAHKGVTELRVVRSMHQRKAMMEELADGFIALPGGLGTFEELFEILSWAQLGIHQKPIGLLNVDGYYDLLVRLLAKAVDDGFIQPEYKGILLEQSTPGRLLDALRDYEPPAIIPKWLEREEV